MLRAVLHTLRERLPIQESFHFMAQLPFMLKGLYADGWKFQAKPNRQIRDMRSFVRRVIVEDYPAGHHDILSVKDGENAVRAVLSVLKRHISHGESSDIASTLPDELKPLWNQFPA